MLKPPDTAPTRWGLVAVLVLAGVVSGAQVGKVAPLLPRIRDDLALDMATGGMIASGVNFVGALAAAGLGRSIDRVGRITSVMTGLALMAAGSLLGALAGSGVPLLAGRVLEGLGFMLVIVAVPGLIVQATNPKDQRVALGFWGTYLPLGVGFAMLTAPLFAADHGWRGVWWANLALIGIYAIVFLLAIRGLPLMAPAAQPAPLRMVLRRPGPWILGGIFGCYGLTWYAMTTWLTTFLVEQAGYALSDAARFAGLVVLANCFGNVLSGFVGRVGLPRWLILAATVFTLSFLSLGIFGAHVAPEMAITLAFLFSALGGFVPGTVFASVPNHVRSPLELGVTNGIVVQCTNFGTLLGPPVFAFMVTSLGSWHDARWFLLGIGLCGASLAIVLRAVERRAGIA